MCGKIFTPEAPFDLRVSRLARGARRTVCAQFCRRGCDSRAALGKGVPALGIPLLVACRSPLRQSQPRVRGQREARSWVPSRARPGAGWDWRSASERGRRARPPPGGIPKKNNFASRRVRSDRGAVEAGWTAAAVAGRSPLLGTCLGVTPEARASARPSPAVVDPTPTFTVRGCAWAWKRSSA